MPSKARYDGPYLAVDVKLPSGNFVTVERGHQLPTEVKRDDGETEQVPAALRDELISRTDWSEVDSAKKEDK